VALGSPVTTLVGWTGSVSTVAIPAGWAAVGVAVETTEVGVKVAVGSP
jgi:hypothetical protein